jgi:hypothetical protein
MLFIYLYQVENISVSFIPRDVVAQLVEKLLTSGITRVQIPKISLDSSRPQHVPGVN